VQGGLLGAVGAGEGQGQGQGQGQGEAGGAVVHVVGSWWP